MPTPQTQHYVLGQGDRCCVANNSPNAVRVEVAAAAGGVAMAVTLAPGQAVDLTGMARAPQQVYVYVAHVPPTGGRRLQAVR